MLTEVHRKGVHEVNLVVIQSWENLMGCIRNVNLLEPSLRP